jgi:hypothetical protein
LIDLVVLRGKLRSGELGRVKLDVGNGSRKSEILFSSQPVVADVPDLGRVELTTDGLAFERIAGDESVISGPWRGIEDDTRVERVAHLFRRPSSATFVTCSIRRIEQGDSFVAIAMVGRVDVGPSTSFRESPARRLETIALRGIVRRGIFGAKRALAMVEDWARQELHASPKRRIVRINV